MEMSSEDFRELLTDFEKTYDPFDTYNTNPITAVFEQEESGTINPRWTSGDYNGDTTDSGSHELITARAFGVLFSDIGYINNDESISMLFALSVSLASILPDTTFNLGAGQAFAGHFYNPDTGKNFLGSTSNTAKNNMIDFYDSAKTAYRNSLDTEDENFITELGKSLHYIQDICVPHHAANVTGLNPSHSQFENYVDENINAFIDSYTTVSSSDYINGIQLSTGDIFDYAANWANDKIESVDNILDKSEWENVGRTASRRAVGFTAIILYKILDDLVINLY